MAAHRHPCVGDLTYGADPTLAKRLGLTRQWLHAVRLGFEHPGGRAVGGVRERLPGRPAAGPGQDPRRRATVTAAPRAYGCASPRTAPTVRPASRSARRSSSASRACRRSIEYDALRRRTRCTCWPSAADGLPLGTGRLLHGAAAAAKTGGDLSVGLAGPARGDASEARGLGRRASRWCGPSRRRRARVGLAAVDLHAQTHALGFYERLGYVAYGPEFPDAGIAAPGDAPRSL